jgi:hypothetical protein
VNGAANPNLGYDTAFVGQRRHLWVAIVLTLALAVGARPAAAAPARGRVAAKAKMDSRGDARSRAKASARSKAAARAVPKDPPLPPPQGKVVVFTFEGEGGHLAQRQVINSLRAKGLKVITNLRPVDSAEQYREMAVTLNLVAYVDGEYVGEGDQASATVYVRSGVTGLRAVSTTFAGERRTLPAEIGRGLWDRISPDLSRICADAAKPRKTEREPLRIEAGTPLPNRPPEANDGPQ